MILYTAPEHVPFGLPDCDSIFLAGSIEQGKAVEWQQVVIDALKDEDVVIFNPRRQEWDASWEQSIDNPDFAEQVNWELDNIERANFVFFYFQAGTLSPITLAEYGKVLELSNRGDTAVVVVCEPGFWRRGNVEIMAQRLGVDVHDTLEEGIALLISDPTCG